MADAQDKQGSRSSMGPDVNYLRPDILETTNRTLEDINNIIDSESAPTDSVKHSIAIAAYFFNKNNRTFHSHLVWGNDLWKNRDEIRTYSACELSESEYLSGLLYSALKQRELLDENERGLLALVATDVNMNDTHLTTNFQPWLWDASYREIHQGSKKKKYQQVPDPENENSKSRRDEWFRFATKYYLDGLKYYLSAHAKGEFNAYSIPTLVIPVFDTWVAGRGCGGVWGAMVCSFANDEARKAFLEIAQKNQLLDLLLEVERLAAEYFEAGLAKIANEKITPPYDWLELFVKRLHWIQDWDRVTVLDNTTKKISYCYRHHEPAEGSIKWEWKRCENGSEEKCEDCRKEAPAIPVFRWKDIEHTSGTHPILNDSLIKELKSSEESQVKHIDIEFKFPISAVVRDSGGELERHFKLAIARQHIAALRILLPIVRTRRAALRTAVSAIMGRNMSHNIGSHVLARYGSKIRKDLIPQNDDGKPDHRADFLSYLQRRMDFLAEVATSNEAFWLQPLNLKEQIARLNFGEQKKRFGRHNDCTVMSNEHCTNYLSSKEHVWQQGDPVLLSFITGKESLLASVEYGEPRICPASPPPPEGCAPGDLSMAPGNEHLWFACPGGEIGLHALYVILENIIRNSARHGADDGKTVRVFIRVEDEPDNAELLKLEIIDPRTRLSADGCPLEGDGQSVSHPEDIRNEIRELAGKRSLFDKTGKRRMLLRPPANINSILADEPFLDDVGAPNPKYWGVREMQICAHYLRGFPLSELEGKNEGEYPVLEADCHFLPDMSYCLKYRLYLQRAKLMAVAAHGLNGQPHDYNVLRSKGIRLIDVPNDSKTNWQEIGKQAEGFSFLVVDEAIRLPMKIDEATTRALLPVRTIPWTNPHNIIGEAENSQGIDWMAPLHKCWAERCRDERMAWRGKPIWGVAMQAQEALHHDEQGSPSYLENGGLIWINQNEHTQRYQLDNVFIEGIQNKQIVGVAFIDHPNQGLFEAGNNGIDQAYQPRLGIAVDHAWISAEGVVSDSPHAAYLNFPSAGGWEILAAAIHRVAVLDERVQSERKDGLFRNISLGNVVWPAMGVWVPEKGKCNLDSPILDQCQAFLNDPANRKDQHPVDFLVLHLTILERLAKTAGKLLGDTLSELVSGTQAKDADIIIVTGRGVPSVASSVEKDRLDEVRYLPVSALLESLVSRPSKLALMRAIWSAGRPKPNSNY